MSKREEKVIRATFDEDGHIIDWVEITEPEPKPSHSTSGGVSFPTPKVKDPMEEMYEHIMTSMLGKVPERWKPTPKDREDSNENPIGNAVDKPKEPLTVQGFHRKLASIMRDNKYDRTVSGFRSGKLDTNRLYKVMANSDRVFKRKFERLNKEYNVVILIDESGSMRAGVYDEKGKRIDSRLGMAINMTTLLVGGLEKNNINFALIGFNHRILVHKNFGEKLNIKKFRDDAIENEESYGGCNHDAGAMLKARQLLSKQTSGKNLIITLSDGQPACCGSCELRAEVMESVGTTDSGDALKREVKRAEKFADVTAIGINTEDVKRYYSNYFVANTEPEFTSGLLRTLKQRVRRG